ncbi:LytR/AlgR family response regulator transcription factor [Brumimicrobium mesophilum]|uniref:LytR/AlgR family response regulator transcription factor n=1 Tax=Brumimicrobium mesophilum TaxID=392717 RepID=UPI000D144CA4|nr:LytTR family DNA-binding domain-containing protein [Brumimicrobium mesophilum]
MRAIVIDDERIAREGLLEYLKRFDFIECIGDFGNALHALELINNKQVDIIFLDIDMPHINGIQFAEKINNSSTMIIFTTAYPEYALKGYKVNTIDYLIKPIFFKEFEAAVIKAKEMFGLMNPENEVSKFIFFRENGVDKRIILKDIIYIKSLQNYVQIHLEDGQSIIVHKTLKSLIEELSKVDFIQIHRSYVIQINKILSIEGFQVKLVDHVLPISRERKAMLLEVLEN